MHHVMKFQAPFERLKEYSSSPEVSLYKAIITQAIIDATNISPNPKARALEIDARNWIFGNGEYFRKICHIADFEPTFIVKITKEAIRLNHKKLDHQELVAKKRISRSKDKELVEEKMKMTV